MPAPTPPRRTKLNWFARWLTPAQRRSLALAPGKRSEPVERELFQQFRQHDPEFTTLNKQIDEAWAGWPDAATTLALQERSEPRVTRIFNRGDWQRPKDPVEPDVPAFLHSFPPDAPRNRLGLAQWIVDRRSPTT